MTLDEAINILKQYVDYDNPDVPDFYTMAEAIEVVIKALEQEPCEDCISRQAVLAIAGDSCLDLDSYEDTKEFCDEIKELPSVTPQQETGHWITEIKSDLRGDMWPTNPKCSKCGGEPYYSNNIYDYKFCPYCGIKMQEVEE